MRSLVVFIACLFLVTQLKKYLSILKLETQEGFLSAVTIFGNGVFGAQLWCFKGANLSLFCYKENEKFPSIIPL